jgi:hypothetical protein
MSKTLKVLLGIVTLWPFAYMILFFLFIFAMMLLPSFGETSGAPPLFVIIFPLHLLTMLIIMALTVFYIANVFNNERVDKDKKVLWALVLFMGNIIAMPIYWYIYIWKSAPVLDTLTTGQLTGLDSSMWANNATTQRADNPQYVPPAQPPNWRE